MSNISKQISNMEESLFSIEAAIDASLTRKDQDELYRKKNTVVKKLKKLKRRLHNESSDGSRTSQDDRYWR
tara:strand:+ start:95 stop:307 length:213 start_codon:yes stop_codon:yes gene_type:complete